MMFIKPLIIKVEGKPPDTTRLTTFPYDMPPKKRIPKRESTELLQDVKLDSPDAKELLANLRRTCLADENIERLWTPQTIHMVQNAELQRNYEQRKKELKESGRKAKEIEDKIVFVADTWAGIQKICKFGIRCLEKKRHVLGDTKHGVHLNRHFDVLLRFMAFKNVCKVRYVIVFKAMFGRTKAVTAKLDDDQQPIEPIPNCDSHISNKKPDIQMDIYEALSHNYVYLYEYDEETSYPVQFPRIVLPYAVIQMSRTQVSIDRPLKWRTTKKTNTKSRPSFGTTQRKTWNSRAAAYSAGIVVDGMKENTLPTSDTNSGMKKESDEGSDDRENHESNVTSLDIKPCKIELFRSDMDIDERLKLPPNFEFDTASGSRLIATNCGFVKDSLHSNEIDECNENGDTIYVTVFEQTSDIGNVKPESFNNVSSLSKIKQEPVDSETQSSVCNISDVDLRPKNIKKETTDIDSDRAFQQQENSNLPSQNSASPSSSQTVNDIANSKEVILKRLEQVEREIHWKKQKIDELQKQSVVAAGYFTDEKSTEISANDVSNKTLKAENCPEAKSNYDTTEMCLMQNKEIRNLSLSIDTGEQVNRDSEEGDATPTLDEPVERLWTDIDVTGKTPVFSSENMKSQPVKPSNNDITSKTPPFTSESLSVKRNENISERKNIFDAYSNENIFLVKGLNDASRNISSNASLPKTSAGSVKDKVISPLKLEPLSENEVTQSANIERSQSLQYSSSEDKKSFEKLIEANMLLSPLPEPRKELVLRHQQSKYSPLDVFKNEKKCSPFLAKYLEKKYSISGLDDTTKGNEKCADEMASLGNFVENTENRQYSNPMINVTDNQPCDRKPEIALLSPTVTKSEDSKGFSFSAAVANIKKIMETGELAEDSSNPSILNVQKITPNPRDPRYFRMSIESQNGLCNSETTEIGSKRDNTEPVNKSKETMVISDDSTTSVKKPKWLPGVVLQSEDDMKVVSPDKDTSSESVSQESKRIVDTRDNTSESVADDSPSTSYNNIKSNVESSKSELPENVEHEMKVTLQKLGDAIKVIQSRCNSDEESSPVKNTKDPEVSAESAINSESENKNIQTVENNIKSDLERTNRVLNDVFGSDMTQTANGHSITNIQQIQTVATTNIEITTTNYTGTMDSTYLNGYDASAYSAVVAKEAVGHRIPVKLSGMGMRRPYTKWAENFRLKAMERQKRLYKSKLVRRFGFDKLKRTRESERKGRLDTKRHQIVLRKHSRKRRSRSRSSSKPRHSRSDSYGNKSRSRSKSNHAPSPTKPSENHYNKASRRRSREESSGRRDHRSESRSDHCSSPKRSRKMELSPVRDMSFMSFKERGVIMYKLKQGLQLSFVERQKYFRNRHKFLASRALLTKAIKTERTTKLKRQLEEKPYHRFREQNRSVDKNKREIETRDKYSSFSSESFANKNYKKTKNDRSHERNHIEQKRFKPFATLGKYSSMHNSRDSRYKPELRSGYQKYNQQSSRSNDFRGKNDLNRNYSRDHSDKTESNSDRDRNGRRYSRGESHSSESIKEGRFNSRSQVETGNDNAERNNEKTLSKAMTSLLTKIIQGDSNQSVDNSTEGQMANMIYQLMKQKVQNETTSVLSRATSNIYDDPVPSYDHHVKSGSEIQSSLIDYQLSRQHGNNNNNIYQSGGRGRDNGQRSHLRNDFSESNRSYQSSGRNISGNNFHYHDRHRSSSRDRDSFYQKNDHRSTSRNFQHRNVPQSNFNSTGGRGFPSSRRYQQRGSSKFQNQSERGPYQRRDFYNDRRPFRHGSSSSSSSSPSRHEPNTRSNRNF